MVGLKDEKISDEKVYGTVCGEFARRGIEGFAGEYVGIGSYQGQRVFVKINPDIVRHGTERRALESLADIPNVPSMKECFEVPIPGKKAVGVLLTEFVPGIEATFCSLDPNLVEQLGLIVDFVDCCIERGFYNCDIRPRNLMYDGRTIRFVDFDAVLFMDTPSGRYAGGRDNVVELSCYKNSLSCLKHAVDSHATRVTPQDGLLSRIMKSNDYKRRSKYARKWTGLHREFDEFLWSSHLKNRENIIAKTDEWKEKILSLLEESAEAGDL